MFLALFQQDTRRIFHGKRGQLSQFGHTFGWQTPLPAAVGTQVSQAVQLFVQVPSALQV